MQELLRDPVIQQTRLMPSEDAENPLDQLEVSDKGKNNQPIQVRKEGWKTITMCNISLFFSLVQRRVKKMMQSRCGH